MQWLRRHWLILGILFLALVLRLPHLNGSFWLDEAAQALESARPFDQQLQIRDDFQPPLLHYVVHFLLYVSRSEWWLRTGAALLPGLVTIWGTYYLGKKLFGEWVGRASAVLLASSSLHVFFSQELRQYSLPAMWAVLSWIVIVILKEHSKKAQTRRNWWITYGVLSVAGLYTSYLYPFLLLSQVVYVLWLMPSARKAVLFTLSGITVGVLPWIPFFLSQLHAGQTLRSDLPGWESVVSFDQIKSLVLIAGKFLFGVLDLELNVFFLVVLGLIGVSVAVSIWALWQQKKLMGLVPKLKLLLMWCVVPILSAWLVSFVVPVLQPKRVLFALPAFYLLITVVLAELQGNKKKKSPLPYLAQGIWIFLIVLNLYSTFSYYLLPKYQREDWRGLHEQIVKDYPADRSVVVHAFPEAFAPWRWYDDGTYPTVATGVLSTSNTESLRSIRLTTQYAHVLVFDYLRDLTDPEDKVLTELEKYGYQEKERIVPATPIGFVRVYARSDAFLTER